MKHLVIARLTAFLFLFGLAGASAAQPQTVKSSPSRGFLEVAGDYGLQFGTESYVPDGAPDTSKNPLTNGFGFNVTAGYPVLPDLDIILDYSYTTAQSRRGHVATVLDRIDGSIKYQTVEAGLRSSRSVGPGRLYGELALGVVFPFETKLSYEYAEEMSELGLTGTGTRTDTFNPGLGAHGELGYQLPLWKELYLGTGLRIAGFQSTNDGEATELDNFVADWTMPAPTDTTIRYGTSSVNTPSTYSVQDLRLHINVGYRF